MGIDTDLAPEAGAWDSNKERDGEWSWLLEALNSRVWMAAAAGQSACPCHQPEAPFVIVMLHFTLRIEVSKWGGQEVTVTNVQPIILPTVCQSP